MGGDQTCGWHRHPVKVAADKDVLCLYFKLEETILSDNTKLEGYSTQSKIIKNLIF